MTEILPTFTKISTLLDYANSSRSAAKTTELRGRQQDSDAYGRTLNSGTVASYVNTNRAISSPNKEKRKMAESLNILKNVRGKLSKVISMRYIQFPKEVRIPFLKYYYDLVNDALMPPLHNIYISNVKTNIKAVCTYREDLQFG